MARFSRFRRGYARARTIVKYVKTRARRRTFRPRNKNQKMFLMIGALAVAGFIFKDKIKTMISK